MIPNRNVAADWVILNLNRHDATARIVEHVVWFRSLIAGFLTNAPSSSTCADVGIRAALAALANSWRAETVSAK
jgi:hypothetical protein